MDIVWVVQVAVNVMETVDIFVIHNIIKEEKMSNNKKSNFKFIVEPTNKSSYGYCFGCAGSGQCNGDCGHLCNEQHNR